MKDLVKLGSAVTVTEPKPKTAFFLSEPWRIETKVFWSHVSGFNQGSFGQVVSRTQLIHSGWHAHSKAKHADHWRHTNLRSVSFKTGKFAETLA